MSSKAITLMIAVAIAASCYADSAWAQNPWRSHYVRRDGLFRVERYHSGNGITPAGATVLNTGITSFAPVVMALAKEGPDDNQNRSARARTFADDASYQAELKRANDLLERTQNLLSGQSVVPANGGNPGGQPAANNAVSPPVGPGFTPTDPWKQRP